MRHILEKSAVMMQADGALTVNPLSSIRYMPIYAASQKLPDYVIKEATVEA